MIDFLIHSEDDDVGVVVKPRAVGELDGYCIEAGTKLTAKVLDPIEFGHKFALRDLPARAVVTKAGVRIGRTQQDIECGRHVHTHNLESILWPRGS